jgi:toxin ParE1/3/4
MSAYVLSPAADDDIAHILEWTHLHFGESARLRYQRLLIRAILDVAENPNLIGSIRQEGLAVDARMYHLVNSRKHIHPAGQRVKQPRHFLVYRVRDIIEVGRVLHESAQFTRHLPEDYMS